MKGKLKEILGYKTLHKRVSLASSPRPRQEEPSQEETQVGKSPQQRGNKWETYKMEVIKKE